MKIFLISGKLNNGKSTVGNILQSFIEIQLYLKQKKCSVLRIAYADLVKFVSGKYFGWNGNKDEIGRGILQYVGTDVGRKNNENMWVNIMAELIKGFKSEFDCVIIDDWRFPNELTTLQSLLPKNEYEFITIRVERIENIDYELSKEKLNHESETALDKWNFDYWIVNDDSYESLNEQVSNILVQL